jgi:CDGSH-type Zn-finger protein
MRNARAGEPATLIIPYQDGPLIIRGDFQIQSWDGIPIPAGRQTVALCRCGRSALKPFCDGSHARTGFRTGRRRGTQAPEDRRKDKTDRGRAQDKPPGGDSGQARP